MEHDMGTGEEPPAGETGLEQGESGGELEDEPEDDGAEGDDEEQ